MAVVEMMEATIFMLEKRKRKENNNNGRQELINDTYMYVIEMNIGKLFNEYLMSIKNTAFFS